MRRPHSNAFLDLNADRTADLLVTGKERLEVWLGLEFDQGYELNDSFPVQLTGGRRPIHVGQSLYIDHELTGEQRLLTPVCVDVDCAGSSLLIRRKDGGWHDLQVKF